MSRPRGAPTQASWSAVALTLCAAVGSAQQATATAAAHGGLAVSLYTGISYVFDSNLDHSQPGLQTFGVLGGVGGECRLRTSSTRFDLQYDGVFRRYLDTDIWNVPGHEASASLEQRVGGRWTLGASGEVAINGSAEDRVLRNEYGVQPQLEYRFNRSNRLLAYGEYLVKRYPNPLGQDAVDPRVGVRFRQLLGERWSWAVSSRYEYNRADSTRYRYVGWTLGADFNNPVGARGGISSGVRYRIRRYTARLVDVGDTKVLRRDSDWVVAVTWRQAVGGLWEIVYGYRWERYGSNDTRREFRDHLVSMTLRRWW